MAHFMMNMIREYSQRSPHGGMTMTCLMFLNASPWLLPWGKAELRTQLVVTSWRQEPASSKGPHQRNSSFSVVSVVFWIWFVTPVSPRSSVVPLHLQSLFYLVSQNSPEQFKQVNYSKCCSCLKICYGLSTNFSPSTWSIVVSKIQV